jgi:hypothetical protein
MPSPTTIRSTDAMSCRPCTQQDNEPVTEFSSHMSARHWEEVAQPTNLVVVHAAIRARHDSCQQPPERRTFLVTLLV